MQAKIETDIQKQAIELARSWQNRANELLTSEEEKIQEQMTGLLNNPADTIEFDFQDAGSQGYICYKIRLNILSDLYVR